MKKIYYLVLLLLPLLLVITAVFLNNARGPYWLGSNLDPEYVYLLNGSNLASWKGVGHIDHPGTPVQVLSAVTMRVVHFFHFSSDIDFHTDVLKRPEYYLNTINGVMVTLNALMLLILGIVTFKLTQNIGLGLLLQLSPFFSITLLQFGLTRVTPEPLLLLTGLMIALILVILSQVWVKNSSKEYTLIIIIFAAATGLGIASKVTFIPLIIIPLMVLRGFKERLYYISATGISFIIFTLPIIRMYPRFFDWIHKLLTHSGHYGSGPSRLISSKLYLKNIQKLLNDNPFFYIVLFLSLFILVTTLFIPKFRKLSVSNYHFKFLAAVTAAQVAGVLAVSKHSANHYLLPALSLSGISLFLIFFYFKHLLNYYKINVTRYLAIPLVLFLTALFILINPLKQIKKRVNYLTKIKENSLAIHQKMENDYKEYAKIFYYRSSSPEYALKFGNDLSRSSHSEALEKIYKNVYFYDIWKKKFSNFNYNRRVTFEQIRLKHEDKIIFQGTRGIKMPGMKLGEIYKTGSYESVFTIDSSK